VAKRRSYSNGRIYLRGPIYWASLYINGVEVRRRGGTEAQARGVLEELRRERDRGHASLKLDDVLKLYRRNLATRSKQNTLRTWDEATRILENYWGRDYDVTTLTTQAVLDFLKERRRKRAAITANRPMRVLRTALRYAVGEKVLKEMPCRIKLLPEGVKLPTILSPHQVRVLISSTAVPAVKLAIFIAYGCGLRHDEIVHLRVRDIYKGQSGPVLAVSSYEGWTPKTHQEREVPLNATTAVAVRWYLGEVHKFRENKDAPLIYWTVEGRPDEPLRYRDLYKPVRAAFKAANLWSKEAKSGLHMLRRSFASRMLGSGVDLATLKELGGWSTIEACQRYLTSTTQRKRDAVATLDF
jgi:site-specific recombinase XerD